MHWQLTARLLVVLLSTCCGTRGCAGCCCCCSCCCSCSCSGCCSLLRPPDVAGPTMIGLGELPGMTGLLLLLGEGLLLLLLLLLLGEGLLLL